MTYEGLTDEQASEQRLADRGDAWAAADGAAYVFQDGWLGDSWRQALHDRDRFQRERDWWREQAA